MRSVLAFILSLFLAVPAFGAGISIPPSSPFTVLNNPANNPDKGLVRQYGGHTGWFVNPLFGLAIKPDSADGNSRAFEMQIDLDSTANTTNTVSGVFISITDNSTSDFDVGDVTAATFQVGMTDTGEIGDVIALALLAQSAVGREITSGNSLLGIHNFVPTFGGIFSTGKKNNVSIAGAWHEVKVDGSSGAPVTIAGDVAGVYINAYTDGGLVIDSWTGDLAGIIIEPAFLHSSGTMVDYYSVYLKAESGSAAVSGKKYAFYNDQSFESWMGDGNMGWGPGATDPDMMLHVDRGTGYGDLKLDGSSGGCVMFRDTDDAGWTEVTFLNGTMTSTTDADGQCDGS